MGPHASIKINILKEARNELLKRQTGGADVIKELTTVNNKLREYKGLLSAKKKYK
jgi:hypothetical protein